jgi:hypothetical protein
MVRWVGGWMMDGVHCTKTLCSKLPPPLTITLSLLETSDFRVYILKDSKNILSPTIFFETKLSINIKEIYDCEILENESLEEEQA